MSVKIAVIAKEGIRLDAFLTGLEASSLADAELQLLSATPEDQSAVLGSKALSFSLIDDADFAGVALCVILENKLAVEANVERLGQLTCPILGFFSDIEALNPVGLESEGGEGLVFGLLQPAVQAMQEVFTGIDVDCLDVTVLYPVSVYGQAAVEELAAQTAKLLNGQTVDAGFFHTQMAFNYFSMQATTSGKEIEETFSSQLAAIFSDAEVSARAIQMPVFHGVGVSVFVEVSDQVAIDEFVNNLKDKDGVLFHEGSGGLSNFEFVQPEGGVISVGNLARDPEKSHRFQCTLGFDEVKLAYGKNMINASEKLLKTFL